MPSASHSAMRPSRLRCNTSHVVLLVLSLPTLYLAYHYNIWEYARTRPFANFAYPLDVNMEEIVERVLHGERPGIEPINAAKYPFIINNDRKCKGPDGEDEDVFLVFLIKSRLEDFDQRKMIRKTWGREWLIPYVKIRRVFLLGTNFHDRKLQHRIGLEAQEFDDIVQQYFDDTYMNNTLKLLMGLQWSTNYCRTARFLAFLDDDYYVNTYGLVAMLQRVKPNDVYDLLIGYIWQHAMPYRVKSSKWYVSLEEYPYRLWPPYPTAGSFFVPFETAERLYAAMPYIKYLRFDDVFVGIAAWKLKIRLQHSDALHFYDIPWHDRAKFRQVIAAHGFSDVELLYKVWKQLEDDRKVEEELKRIH